MRRDVLIMDSETSVSEAARTMRDRGYGSVLVSREGKVSGIVTERDILYKVVAEDRDPRETRLGEVMSSPLISVGPDVSLAEAVALMSSRGVRRLVVMHGDEVLGIVSQIAMMGDIVRRRQLMPEVEETEVVRCPYCGSIFNSVDDLSRHIDRTHIGLGLLEGNVERW